MVLSDDHWTMSGPGYYRWTWTADWLFGLTLALPHYHAFAWGSGLLAELGSDLFFLITLLGTVGLGIGWSGPCFADHVFMSLRGQPAFAAAPWQVEGFVEGGSLTCIILIQCTLNVQFMFFTWFKATSLPHHYHLLLWSFPPSYLKLTFSVVSISANITFIQSSHLWIHWLGSYLRKNFCNTLHNTSSNLMLNCEYSFPISSVYPSVLHLYVVFFP